MYLKFGKRLFDLTVTLLGLLFGWPIVVVIAILVRRRLGAPILFRQTRPGQHGRLFTIYKFRTMTDARDAEGHLLPDAARLLPFGRWLRSTSLDELPELINVLRGEMSLVGPRPLMPHYLPRYSPAQMHRHDILPGITGWAQINGRNTLSWERKFELDLWYLTHASLLLDMRILALTVLQVFKREGIAAEGHATMPEFMGSESDQHDA